MAGDGTHVGCQVDSTEWAYCYTSVVDSQGQFLCPYAQNGILLSGLIIRLCRLATPSLRIGTNGERVSKAALAKNLLSEDYMLSF